MGASCGFALLTANGATGVLLHASGGQVASLLGRSYKELAASFVQDANGERRRREREGTPVSAGEDGPRKLSLRAAKSPEARHRAATAKLYIHRCQRLRHGQKAAERERRCGDYSGGGRVCSRQFRNHRGRIAL